MNVLFESFIVFYLIQILVIVYYIIYFYYEPKQPKKKIWDPLGLQQVKEEQYVKRFRRKSRSVRSSR
jgi:hypothetical protein